MFTILQSELENILMLASLHLSEAEKRKIPDQLGKVIEYFKQIDGLKNSVTSELIHPVSCRNDLREDEVQRSLPRMDILKNAPVKTPEFFLVPQVIDKKRKIDE